MDNIIKVNNLTKTYDNFKLDILECFLLIIFQ